MARIAILHDTFDHYGGAELLCTYAVKALKEAGHTVSLITFKKINWNSVRRFSGMNIAPDKEIIMPSLSNFMPSIILNPLEGFCRDVLAVPLLKKHYDLVIVTKPMVPYSLTDIVFMHFPTFLPTIFLYYHRKYLKTVFWRVYFKVFGLVYNLSEKLQPRTYRPTTLTNSKFSAMITKSYLDIDPIVIYPPVDVAKYMPIGLSNHHRSNIVVTISRFDEVKRLETIVEIAKNVNNVQFIIIGATSPVSGQTIKALHEKARKYGIENRVSLLTDARHEDKLKILSTAKLYLHPMKYEHFGISIVEAMASGLVPIVHKSGGPWLDILGGKQGIYGFGFDGVEDAASHIDTLINNIVLLNKIRKNSVRRARIFDTLEFERRFLRIIDESLQTRS